MSSEVDVIDRSSVKLNATYWMTGKSAMRTAIISLDACIPLIAPLTVAVQQKSDERRREMVHGFSHAGKRVQGTARLAHPSRARPSGVRNGEFCGDTQGPACLAQVRCSGAALSTFVIPSLKVRYSALVERQRSWISPNK